MFSVVANGLFLPTDRGEVADAIVVLGRGKDLRTERVDVAAQLWQAQRAPTVFVSGRGDATAIVQMLEDIIPPRVVNGENCSLTTQENAIFSAAVLDVQRQSKILLVTDLPHMWRSLHDFRNQGFRVIPHSSPLPDTWSWRRKAFLTFRECVALISHGVRGLFTPQQPKTSSPELWNLVEQAEQYGQRYLRGEG